MSIPEHISQILPRVLAGLPGGGMSDPSGWDAIQANKQFPEDWSLGSELGGRVDMHSSYGKSFWNLDVDDAEYLKDKLERLSRLTFAWRSYRSALSQPFGKDRNEDSQITSRVDAAFQALDALSKEG